MSSVVIASVTSSVTPTPSVTPKPIATLNHFGDISALVLYFAIVVIVGLWASCARNRGSVRGYFLAGRNMAWWPVGASLFVSNIGSEHFIGLAGTGAAAGIANVMYEWLSGLLVTLMAWFFLPVYVASGVYTLPEYMNKRFGGQRLRVYISLLSLFIYVVTKIAVCIYAGGLFIQLALGWDLYLSIAILILLTCIITAAGGLTAVIYTDALQSVFIVAGGLIMAIIAFVKIGGYGALKEKYFSAVPGIRPNSTCGLPRSDAFHIFRPADDADSPWPGMILQPSIGCLFYWCSDQVIVQRALAAKDLRHAKGGAILTGYLKLLPLFFMLLPGMISRALFPDEVGCVDAEECMRICGSEIGCTNIAYPKLVLELMPVGLRGLMFSVMMAAIMSSLTSIFNSSATLFTIDIWTRMRTNAGDRELLIVGKVFIVVLCAVSILWVPLVQTSQGGQLWHYIQAVQAMLGTPIGALFSMAILWPRMNEQGAFWGILAGHSCGIARMMLDFIYPVPGCDEPDRRPLVVSAVHFSYMGTILFLITCLVIVLVSLSTQKSDRQLAGVTWWTRYHKPIPTMVEPSNSVQPKAAAEQHVMVSPVNYMISSNGRTIDAASDEVHDGSVEVSHEVVAGVPHRRRWLTIVFGWIQSPHLSKLAAETYLDRMLFLDMSRAWARFLDVQAILGLIVVLVLCIVFR